MVFSQCSAPWERARKRQRTRRFNKLVFKLAEFVALPPKGIELKGTKKISGSGGGGRRYVRSCLKIINSYNFTKLMLFKWGWGGLRVG